MKNYNKVTFDSGMSMYLSINDGSDFWCPELCMYVFGYNEAGSICTYRVTKEEAEELDKKSEYWGAYLGIGGLIYDSSEYKIEHKEDDTTDDAIVWCTEMFNAGEWFDVTKVY